MPGGYPPLQLPTSRREDSLLVLDRLTALPT
jgi:hypothetical protein